MATEAKSDTFVILGAGQSRETLSKKLSEFGRVDPLPNTADAYVLTLNNVPSDDPKQVWEELHNRTGPDRNIITDNRVRTDFNIRINFSFRIDNCSWMYHLASPKEAISSASATN